MTIATPPGEIRDFLALQFIRIISPAYSREPPRSTKHKQIRKRSALCSLSLRPRRRVVMTLETKGPASKEWNSKSCAGCCGSNILAVVTLNVCICGKKMETSHFLRSMGASLKASAGFGSIDNTHFIISIRKLPSGKHHLSSIEALGDNITMLPTMGRHITEGQADPVGR